MGLLDSLKAKLAPAKGKVAHFAHEHEDQIDRGLDKAAKVVDEKTRGKYSDKIHTGTDKAKGAVDRLAHQDGATRDDTFTPPPDGPPPAS
ncbi:antitoxin [Streptomyces sp. NBC_01538]|uniref:antitoxin n=1 Tax=Streptomyces sp. NBC_01538 TaxID=2903897 RepID=UPI003867E87A